MTEVKYDITRKKATFLAVLYFFVAILGFTGAFETTNFVWAMLLVVPSILCVTFAIFWIRYKIK